MPSCEIHKNHAPMPLTDESHHIIPRAWQAVWRPEGDQRVLWAPQTMELCPTGHRSVHELLVMIMKAYAATAPTIGEQARYFAARTAISKDYGRRAEFPVAREACERWLGEGGSLNLLIEHRQYGYGSAHALFLVP